MSFFDESAWFNQAAIKRRSQESNVVLVECSDPKRIEELRNYIRAENIYRTRESGFDIRDDDKLERFELSPWKGLLKLRTGMIEQGVFVPTEKDARGNPLPDQQVEVAGGFMASLHHVEEQMKTRTEKTTVVLLVTNITQKQQADALAIALQELAFDSIATTKRATFFVVTPDAQLFDSHTRRNCVMIKPPVSLENERAELVNFIAQKFSFDYDSEVIRVMEGLTLHDCESLLLELIFGYAKTGQGPHRVDDKTFTKGYIKMKDVATAKMAFLSKYGYIVEYPKNGYEAVGGYESVKQLLRENVIDIINDPRAREMGVGPARGIILFGPPGTGKSLLSRATSKEIGLPLVLASPATFLGGIVGESERKTEQFFHMIEAMRSFTLIDEADALGQKRQNVMSTDSGAGRHVVNQILDYMGREERRSIIVLATNLIEAMDEAFTRPGRIDLKIPILYPNLKARYEILKVHASLKRHINLVGDGDLLQEIAKATNGWVGSELENLVATAARKALHKQHGSERVQVGRQDFIDAMSDVGVNPEAREEQMKHFYEVAEKYSSSKTIFKEHLAGDSEREQSRVDIVEEGLRKKKK